MDRVLEAPKLDFLRRVEELAPTKGPGGKKGGDFIDGMLVALDHMAHHTGTKKYKRRVFLITDGEGKAEATADEL